MAIQIVYLLLATIYYGGLKRHTWHEEDVQRFKWIIETVKLAIPPFSHQSRTLFTGTTRGTRRTLYTMLKPDLHLLNLDCTYLCF